MRATLDINNESKIADVPNSFEKIWLSKENEKNEFWQLGSKEKPSEITVD